MVGLEPGQNLTSSVIAEALFAPIAAGQAVIDSIESISCIDRYRDPFLLSILLPW